MITEELKNKSKEETLIFIRESLRFNKGIINSLRDLSQEQIDKQHKRFNMSGYESETGECTIWNTNILNEFAYLGIYDYTSYLFLDFYKGEPTLYLKYFGEDENIIIDTWNGNGTVDIIYKIFELTILSDKIKRRRI